MIDALIQIELWLALVATIVFIIVLIKFYLFLDDAKKAAKNINDITENVSSWGDKLHSSFENVSDLVKGAIAAYEEVRKIKDSLLEKGKSKKERK